MFLRQALVGIRTASGAEASAVMRPQTLGARTVGDAGAGDCGASLLAEELESSDLATN